MGRIKESDRLPLLDDHASHWGEANALTANPVVLDLNTVPPSTLTLAQFEQLREDYEAKGNAESELELTILPTLRQDRDLLFGISPTDETALWFWLMKYKPAVRLKLGRKKSLSRTIPNLGEIIPGTYLSLLQRFIDHWELVNPALPAPFVLGTMTLADLIAKRDAIEAKAKLIAKKEAALALLRQQREDLFGDVVEDDRDDTSLVTIMETYHVAIELKFAGQAIVTTLPRIFPEQDGPLPKFKFNWRDLGGGQLKTWVADPAVTTAATLYLKEGAVEQTKPFTPGVEDSVTVQTWIGIAMVGELDVLELRDAEGKTIARGNRDSGLGEPS
ncbi:MAG: hypothetical protein FD161_1386 [Limisphaerales bacterium]|nr:MAG: hypothetical protein FD161_1386 [Limisphaerales bacterium]KAG0509463.1 MAG: hypothetical protein E1N63_1305 [Limisphaerales bacterium]TXT52300.1 MAG: hypothetical protein FD140_787 [Limisphaerales bacterium]